MKQHIILLYTSIISVVMLHHVTGSGMFLCYKSYKNIKVGDKWNNLFDRDRISINEAAVIKSYKFKFLLLFCQLMWFDIKGHNHQTHPKF